MKDCTFCGEQIQSTARKCRYCQSFQNPADAPGPRIEIANLVIGMVGLVTLVFAVLGGLYGYIGFNSLSELDARADEASKKFVIIPLTYGTPMPILRVLEVRNGKNVHGSRLLQTVSR